MSSSQLGSGRGDRGSRGGVVGPDDVRLAVHGMPTDEMAVEEQREE